MDSKHNKDSGAGQTDSRQFERDVSKSGTPDAGIETAKRKRGSLRRALRPAALALPLAMLAMPGHADDGDIAYTGNQDVKRSMHSLDVGTNYTLGINRFDVDAHTEILGWQIYDNWYFGRQDGLDSGLTLVWQQKTSQVSLSKDGLRLTRRF